MTDGEAIDRAQRISLRALQTVAACLAVVILVLTLSLTIMLGLMRQSAQRADNLSNELACRSNIVNEHALAQSAMQTTIAEALLNVGRGEPIPPEVTERLDAEIRALRVADERRNRSVELCADANGDS